MPVSGQDVKWVPFSRAMRQHNLTGDQIQYGILLGWIESRSAGSYRTDLNESDLLAHIDDLRRLPAAIFHTKTYVMKTFGLTSNQVSLAVENGLLHVINRKVRGWKYPLILIPVNEVQKSLESIRSYPRYSERERQKQKIYRAHSKLRLAMGFVCPRCGRMVRVRRDSELFRMYLSGQAGEEELLRGVILSHYRYEHTDYREALKEPEKHIPRWLARKWDELIKYYTENMDDMEKYERQAYIEEIREMRNRIKEELKAEFNRTAEKLAREDNLLEDEPPDYS